MAKSCTHLDLIEVTQPKRHVCDDCAKTGDSWVHLRMCLICGHHACCDDSPNRHMTAHYHATGHPLMRSIEPGERWVWCYVDSIVPAEIPD